MTNLSIKDQLKVFKKLIEIKGLTQNPKHQSLILKPQTLNLKTQVPNTCNLSKKTPNRLTNTLE
jgi:hypothetical protein